MGAVVRSSFRVILPLLKTQLVTAGAFGTSAITLSLVGIPMESLPGLVGEHDCFLMAGDERNEGDFDNASSWFDRRVRRAVQVLIRTRLQLDKVNEFSDWLTNATLGHLQLEDSIFDALDDFKVLNSSSDQVVFESLLVTGIAAPRMVRAQKGWGGSIINVEVGYVRSVTQSGTAGTG